MTDVWAGIVRVSHMGARKAGSEEFHAERDQAAAIAGAVPPGAALEILAAELDVSGGLPLEQRPSLLAAVEGVEQGLYAGIVVAYQSRLGRDTEYEEGVWRRVEAAGGRIILALDGIDTSTVDGKMVRRIRGAINHAERERHAENFDNLRRWATEAGVWQRRQTPRGYRRDERTRRLVPDAAADSVRLAFEQRAAGVAVSRLADLLRMTTGGVRALLRNRVYLGELRVGDYVNAAAHPPIVDVATWEAAQSTAPRPGRSVGGQPALLAGIIRCQACGHVMSRSKTAAVVYVCHGRSSAGRCPAPAAVTAALVDALVERVARRELERLTVRSSDSGDDVARAVEALEVAERELDAYIAAVSAADVGAEAFAAGARSRRAAVDEARGDLQRRMAVRPVGPAFDAGSDAWGALDAHGRNAVLRALLEVVVVRRAGGRGARTALEDRLRVLRHGAGVLPPSPAGGRGAGIRPLPFLDVDDERVLRVPVAEG